MWPKALLEIVPHIARLLPMADRFFASKSGNEEANQRALNAMAEGLRGDLGQVTAAHAGLYRQLNDIDAKLLDLTASTKSNAQSTDSRITTLEHRLDRIAILLLTATVLLTATLITVLYLALHHHA